MSEAPEPDESSAIGPRVARASPRDPLAEALCLARTLADFGEGDGRLHLDQYEIDRRIGAGGHGAVYLARQPSVGGRLVAIKLLHAGVIEGPAGLDRLRREALALASLDHPNVVKVYDVGSSEFGAFMVMEHVVGDSLAAWAKHGPPVRAVIDAWAQVGAALAAAHARGILHLDVKPSNALRSPDGRVRVLDFGIAGGHGVGAEDVTVETGASDSGQRRSPITQASGWTDGYASPEQILRRPVDPRSDQFSFCVAMWEALYGMRPYSPAEIRTLGETADAQTRPRRGARRGPRAVERALRRGLAARPEDRWPDMDALLAVIRRSPWPRRPTTWGLAGALVVGGPLLLYRGLAAPDVCADPSAELDGVWDDRVRAEAAAAFGDIAVAYANRSWDHIERQVDARVAAWIDATRSGCTAAVAAGAFGGPDHLRRTACLTRYRERLGRFTALLAQADRALVERTPALLAELATPDECTHAPVDEAGTTAGPEAQAVVGEIDSGRLLLAAGRLDDAVTASEHALARAIAVADVGTSAEAHMFRGMALDQVGRDEEAQDQLLEAVALALAADREPLAAEGWRRLTWLAADDLQDLTRANEWSRMGMATLEHLGRPPRLYAQQLDAIGRMELLRGDPKSAARAHRTALAQLEGILDPGDVGLADSLTGLAHAVAESGSLDEAAALYDRALALSVAALGDSHPRVADLHLSIGLLARDRGDLEVAAQESARAEDILLACCGAEAPGLAAVLAARADVAAARGRLDEAEAVAERAWALEQRHLPPGHTDRGNALAVLVNVALVRGDAERALAANRRLAVELRVAVETQGRGADALATVENNIGWYLCELGRCAEAREHYEGVIAMPEVAAAHRIHATSGLAAVELAAGQPQAARALLEPSLRDALALSEPDPAVVAAVRWRLATALARLGVEPARRRALAAAAREYYRENPEPTASAELDRLLNDTP